MKYSYILSIALLIASALAIDLPEVSVKDFKVGYFHQKLDHFNF
jgi:hypothetical protein